MRLAGTINRAARRNLRSFGGTTVFSPGTTQLQLDLGYGPFEEHPFNVVSEPLQHIIMGIDFLMKHNLTLDMSANRLVHRTSGNHSQAVILDGTNPASIQKHFTNHNTDESTNLNENQMQKDQTNNVNDAPELCANILKQFPKIIGTPDYTIPPKHNHKLDIITTQGFKPIYSRPRRGSAADLATARDTFEDLINRGAMIRSSSNCASPVTYAQKKDGKTRVCIDYRKLNAQTVKLNFPLPLIQSLATKLTPYHQYFSVLDLSEAYQSLPLTPRASRLAAAITADGVYVPLRCPYGLVNAPAKFCELIKEVIHGMHEYVFSYIDDFIVYSCTLESHLKHLKNLCTRFEQYGLYVKVSKCHLGKTEVAFLGYTVSRAGMKPIASRVVAITQRRPPTTLKELRGFLGALNYYRKHLPNIARILSPLNDLLKGKKVRKGPLKGWGSKEQDAFDLAIKTLKNAVTLAHENPNLPLYLTTDASGHHVGGVLEQRISHNDTAMRPLAFFSAPLAPTICTRSAFYRELRGIVMNLRHFKYRVRGRELIIRTDHKSLVRALENGEGEHSPQETAMLAHVNEYLPTIQYLPGEENVVADLLSRPTETPHSEKNDLTEKPINLLASSDSDTQPTLSLELLAEEQAKENSLLGDTNDYIKQRKLPLKIQGKSVSAQPTLLLYGVLDDEGNNFRPIVPTTLRALVFHSLHDIIHPGQNRTTSLVGAHYFWPYLPTNISKWVKTCPVCQRVKVTRHNRQRLQNFPSSMSRLSTIHIDLVGPLPPSDDFKYLLTIRDRGTGFSLAIPLRDKSSVGVIEALRLHLISIFGVPTTIVSDNGGEFTSAAFDEFCSNYGIRHNFTTPYHPISNGLVERLHRTLKQALRALDHPDTWSNHIPDIILLLNNLPSDTNDFTPFQMTFGQSANIPGACLISDTTNTTPPAVEDVYAFFHNMDMHHRTARPLSEDHYIHPDLVTTDHVWVKNPARQHALSPLYKGPFRVLHRSEKWFSILQDNHVRQVSVDNTKPAYGFTEETPTDEAAPTEHELESEAEEVESPRPSTSSGRTINPPTWMRDYQ